MSEFSFREAVRQALDDELAEDQRVIFLGQDIGVYGGAFGVSRGLFDKYGEERIIETPISENSVVGVAVGAAMAGYKPVVEIMFQDFVTLAMDQIVNHAAKIAYIYDGQLNAPITLRLASGGGRGYGASHSQTLDSWFMHVPGLKVVAPSMPDDAYTLLRSAIQDPSPVIFIEHKLAYDVKGERPDRYEPKPLRNGRIVTPGTDVTIITYGHMVHVSRVAASVMAEQGVDVEIIDLRVLKPLDQDLITTSVKKTGKAVIVEEGCKIAGVGAEVAGIILEQCLEYLDGRVLRVGAEDTPIPSAGHLEKVVLPDVARIVDSLSRVFI